MRGAYCIVKLARNDPVLKLHLERVFWDSNILQLADDDYLLLGRRSANAGGYWCNFLRLHAQLSIRFVTSQPSNIGCGTLPATSWPIVEQPNWSVTWQLPSASGESRHDPSPQPPRYRESHAEDRGHRLIGRGPAGHCARRGIRQACRGNVFRYRLHAPRCNERR